MSTRSLIGIRNNEGLTFVYCHHDGYLEGVGKTLVENYKEDSKINALLEHGAMCSLDAEIYKCDFYHEDDGDKSITIPDCEDIEERYYKCGENSWADYIYLFEDGEWYYYNLVKAVAENGIVYLPARWELVTEGLDKLKKRNEE